MNMLTKGMWSIWLVALLSLLGVTNSYAEYEEVIYYHNDVLGSPVIASDANGDIKWEEDYDPFGKRREHQSREMENGEPVENLWDETAWFTGKQEETRLGITNMGARWYDPGIGRFMAPDPVGFVEGNPMSFNRYMYVNNNPYRYNDPDGEFLNFVLGGVKAAIENTLIQTAEIALGVRDNFSYSELALETALGTVTSGASSLKNAGKLASLASKVTKGKKIPKADGGFSADLGLSKAKSRSGHSNAGNKQLNEAMAKDPKLRAQIEKKFGTDAFERTSTSGGGRRNPRGAEWDHNSSNPNKLDLRSKANHLQKTRAEGRKGGGYKKFHRK